MGMLHWNPRFIRFSIENNQFLFLSEKEQFLITDSNDCNLLSDFQGPISRESIFAKESRFLDQVSEVYHLDRLLKIGIFKESTQTKEISNQHKEISNQHKEISNQHKEINYQHKEINYHHPNFSLPGQVFHFRNGKLKVQVFSEIKEDFSQYFQGKKFLKGEIQEEITLVIVDDLLDPRLDEINQRHLDNKHPWILMKVTGEQAILGPYFSPQKNQTPCWKCLSSRVLRNQPVRKWVQQREELEYLPIPIRYDQGQLKKIMPWIIDELQQRVLEKCNDQLSAIDPEQLTVSKHHLGYRPQCPACGDPKLFEEQAKKPVLLKPCPKDFHSDGGSRSVPPSQTVEKMQKMISPVSGVINDLRTLPNQKENGVTIYSTSFFKTPSPKKRVQQGDFVQVSLGKGVQNKQSQASALCESLERYATQYEGDEPWDYQTIDHLMARAISPRQLFQYSDRQHLAKTSKKPMQKFYLESQLHWAHGWSLSKREACFLPFTFCYTNTPFDDEVYAPYNSNGCAAGNTLEEAILQGFLELVERDATAIWWYNQIVRPSVCIEDLPKESLLPLQETLDEDWEYWVLDLTHDLNIPVMVGVGRHRKTQGYVLGFGCHLDPLLACQRALTELCQLIPIRDQHSAPFDFNQIETAPFLLPSESQGELSLFELPSVDHSCIREEVYHCVNQADQLNLETIVVNTSRPDLPIHTAKVVVPDLCHIWPQLGNERLYRVPVEMGWKKYELDETELNPLPLFI